eukprot:4671829-Pyramimonas_sp.AAC.1
MGLPVLVAPGFDDMFQSVGTQAAKLRREDQRQSHKSWTSWARAAFEGGASAAHRVSKVPAMDQVIAFPAK